MVADEAANEAFGEFGMPMERIEQRLIGGWVYVGVFPESKGKAPPPAWVFGLLTRLVPSMRAFCR
ncbi:MAG: hypothetical protein ACNA8W_13120 [Bradymonadaceae bacterium]